MCSTTRSQFRKGTARVIREREAGRPGRYLGHVEQVSVSAGLKCTHLCRFCSQSKNSHRRGRGTYSKTVSKFCLALGSSSRYDSASVKRSCTVWTEPACFASLRSRP